MIGGNETPDLELECKGCEENVQLTEEQKEKMFTDIVHRLEDRKNWEKADYDEAIVTLKKLDGYKNSHKFIEFCEEEKNKILPMNWFSWLIYFALFATAVKFTIGAIQKFMGTEYMYMGENLKDYIYSMYGGLEVVDIGYGVALLAVAAFTVFTRFRLAGFKKNGPFFLLSLYPTIMILDLIYVLLAIMVTSGDFDLDAVTPVITASFIVNFVMFLINFKYFKKRKSLFVN